MFESWFVHLDIVKSVRTNQYIVGQLPSKGLVEHLLKIQDCTVSQMFIYIKHCLTNVYMYLQDLGHSEVSIDNLKFKGHVDEDVFAGKSHSVLWKGYLCT